MAVRWPNGKRFAFSVFDDPDAQTLEQSRAIYSLLSDLGFRTTIGVWPLSAPGEANSPGETCDNPDYLQWIKELQQRGFEIGLHSVAPATLERPQIQTGLDRFRQEFGTYPITMANHYNGDAMYWGPKRLSGLQRALYTAVTRGQFGGRYFGEVEGHASFWGDLCRDRVRYCRSLVFPEINTLKACPWMPYHDPDRSYVNQWYSSCEGSVCNSFVENVTEESLERLEAEGGACIMYAHFGHGFHVNGKLDERFKKIMTWLSRRDGWFAPVGTILDHLAAEREDRTISRHDRNTFERRWLAGKLLRGTS